MSAAATVAVRVAVLGEAHETAVVDDHPTGGPRPARVAPEHRVLRMRAPGAGEVVGEAVEGFLRGDFARHHATDLDLVRQG